jgi:hypothetical protein
MRINGGDDDHRLARVMHEAACNRLHRVCRVAAASLRSARVFVPLPTPLMASSHTASIFPAPGRVPENRL